MPATPIYALPYPAASDPADVPLDMQELTDRIEAVLPKVGPSFVTGFAAQAQRANGAALFTITAPALSVPATAFLLVTGVVGFETVPVEGSLLWTAVTGGTLEQSQSAGVGPIPAAKWASVANLARIVDVAAGVAVQGRVNAWVGGAANMYSQALGVILVLPKP